MQHRAQIQSKGDLEMGLYQLQTIEEYLVATMGLYTVVNSGTSINCCLIGDKGHETWDYTYISCSILPGLDKCHGNVCTKKKKKGVVFLKIQHLRC